MSKSLKIYKLESAEQRRSACVNITKQLPEWFAQENSNIQYAKDAEKFPAIVAEFNDQAVALLVYKEILDDVLNEQVVDMHWLGMLPEHHRQGIGKQLVSFLEDLVKEKQINTMTVETLDPEMKDKEYLQSYAFYESLGFETYHHFKYDNVNYMVKMSKGL